MAINKAGSVTPRIFTGESNPNTLKKSPSKPGDIFIDTTLKVFYVSCGNDSTNWGTSGTIGA